MFAAAFLLATAGSAAEAYRPPAGSAVPDAIRSTPLKVAATAEEMLGLADRLEQAGDSERAETILVALSEDPRPAIRNEAKYRRAKAMISRSRVADAALLLRSIVDSQPTATVARLELAKALNLLDRPEDALRELRAAQSLGLPGEIAALVDQYTIALRSRRSSGFSVNIAVAPSTNINRATSRDGLGTIFGEFEIDPGSKAKSGVGLTLGGQAYRRFALGTGDLSLLVRTAANADLYRDKRFDDIRVELATGPEFMLGDTRLALEAGASQQWYGLRPFLRTARLSAVVTRPLGRRAQLRISGNAMKLDNRFNDLQDGKAFSGRVAIERALTPTAGIGISAGVERMIARDAAYSTTGWKAGLIGWKSIGRISLGAEAEVGRLRADNRLILFPKERADRSLKLGLSAIFRQLQMGGFSPTVRLSYERNTSSIAFYDYRRTRLDMGISRAF